jgi:translation initiation factor IF-2
LIVRNGTLHKGEFIVTEGTFAPVRVVENYASEAIAEATPSTPVRITGFTSLPPVGAFFTIKKTKKEAEKAIEEQGVPTTSRQLGDQTSNDETRIIIPVVVKTDVFGTLEALTREIRKLSNEHVCVKIIHADVGVISENDIKIASSAENPIVLGFHTDQDKRAQQMADRLEIKIYTFDIIYKLLEWLAEEIDRRIPKELKQEIIGRSELIRVFSSDKQKHVVGGRVVEGMMQNNIEFRLIRRNRIIGTGKVVELQQQRARVNEVPTGKEFGMMVESKMEPAKGDILELFVMKE